MNRFEKRFLQMGTIVLGVVAFISLSAMLASGILHAAHASPMPPKKLKVEKYPAIEDDGTAEDIVPFPIENCAAMQIQEDEESWDQNLSPSIIEDLSMRRLFIKLQNNEAILKNLKEVDPE